MSSLFCSYETVKYVQVRDSRLGFLRFFLLIGIALYVGVVEMAYMGGYLEATRVVGASRFSLKQPTTNGCDFSSAENCTNDFAPLDTLSYCQQSNNLFYRGAVHPCQIYEAVNAQVIQESSIVVWTRASTKNESLICGSGEEMTCPRTYQSSDSSDDTFYIAESEAFTVLFEHAATASHTRIYARPTKRKVGPQPHRITLALD
jgi:membrane glycosyltransferase